MNSKNIFHDLLILLSATILLAIRPCAASAETTTIKEDLKTIRVVFDLQPAKSEIRHKGDKEYLELQYDPSRDVISALKKVGFRVITDTKTYAGMILTFKHVEEAYSTWVGNTPLSQEVGIKTMMFWLTDADSSYLLKPKYVDGGNPNHVDTKKLQKDFIDKLVELVTIRSEKEDEVSTFIEFVSRKGEKATNREIQKPQIHLIARDRNS